MGAQPIRVLLVSEDRGLLRCLRKLLKICGCEVCQAAAVRQAPAALESVSPDFLILDAQGDLDAVLEISRCASARRARGELYTLLLADSPGVHELYTALEAGVDDFLSNPVVYCELLARLRGGAGVGVGTASRPAERGRSLDRNAESAGVGRPAEPATDCRQRRVAARGLRADGGRLFPALRSSIRLAGRRGGAPHGGGEVAGTGRRIGVRGLVWRRPVRLPAGAQ